MAKYSLAERLRIARESRGLTGARVADLTGITETSLSRYENGKRIPNALVLGSLCRVYGVSANWILGLKKGLKWDDKKDG